VTQRRTDVCSAQTVAVVGGDTSSRKCRDSRFPEVVCLGSGGRCVAWVSDAATGRSS